MSEFLYLVLNICNKPRANPTINNVKNKEMHIFSDSKSHASVPFFIIKFELRHEKTNVCIYANTKTQNSFAVTAKLVSAFVSLHR